MLFSEEDRILQSSLDIGLTGSLNSDLRMVNIPPTNGSTGSKAGGESGVQIKIQTAKKKEESGQKEG